MDNPTQWTKGHGPMVYEGRLRQARERLSLSQADVAERVGVASPATISHWESGKRGVTIPTLHLLSDVYGLSVGWLAGDPTAVPSASLGDATLQRLLVVYEQLGEEQRRRVLSYAEFVAQAEGPRP